MGHWIPVTWLSFGIDHALWGMNAFGYHLTNILLHAANAALVCLLALRLLRLGLTTASPRAISLGAVVAALFFAVMETGAVVGMGATMLQRSRLGAGSMLAAGAVLGEGQEIPAGHMAAGVPASVKKALDGSSGSWVGTTAQHYRDRAVRYRAKLRTAGQ